VLFHRPLDPSTVVDLLDDRGELSLQLSKQSKVAGLNFGVRKAWALRFTHSEADIFSFDVFEPSTVPDHYIVSTYPRDNFVMGTSAHCHPADFVPRPGRTKSFFHLSTQTSAVRITRNRLKEGDRVTYQSPLRSEPIVFGELPTVTVTGFSEWVVRLGEAPGEREFVALFRGSDLTSWERPLIRRVFSESSDVTVLHEEKRLQKEAVADDPCKEWTILERTQQPVGREQAAVGATTVGMCAVGIAVLVLAIAFWPAKARPGRPDMEGLLMSIEVSDGRGQLQPYDTYGIPMVSENRYGF
jgi:hypothetical protein